MTTPGSDQVQQSVNSGQGGPDIPGLSSFASAWRALTDFAGDWAGNYQMQFQAYADLINSYGNWQNPDH